MLAQTPHLTPNEYLEWEPRQELKYEYVNGEVIPMAGGTTQHNIIALNLASAIKAHLRVRGCQVFMADVKVRCSDNGPFHYPDVMVTCDPRDLKATQYVEHPCLIVEVLSDSTEAFDRGDKFRAYRQINELQEYVLINQKAISVDIFRLSERGVWELHSFSQLSNSINFTSINFDLTLAELYEGVNFL